MAIPVLFALLQIGLHLSLGLGYGIFRDELYYWDCANHLTWGYVDHRPSRSRSSPAGRRCSATRSCPCASFRARRGAHLPVGAHRGEARRRGLCAALAAAIAFATPSYLGITGYYSMNAFELLFWAALTLIVLDVLEHDRRRDWILLGLVVGLGTLDKISVLVAGHPPAS
jgi:hypothetical protein